MSFHPRGTLCGGCSWGSSVWPKVDFLPKWQLSEEIPDLSFHSPCIDPCCQKWACDLWTEFPPNPVSTEQCVALLKSPIQVAPRAPPGCWGNWQIYSLVAAWLFSGGSAVFLPASGLSCLFAVGLKCEHCWWCMSQMEVISFEVVLLEAQEQSNCINSSVWVEQAEERTWLDWAEVKKTRQPYKSPWRQGAREPKAVSLTAFK